jgi:hypothetical protein
MAVHRVRRGPIWTRLTLLTQRQAYFYDPMGRLKGEQQCTLGNCSATPYTLSYTYDLAGNLWTSTNGVTSPQATLTYGYDPGGRLNLITSSLNTEPNYPSTLFSASASTTNPCGTSSSFPAYDGANQLQYAQIGFSSGTQPVVTTTRCYDDRLRPTKETDVGQVVSTPGVADERAPAVRVDHGLPRRYFAEISTFARLRPKCWSPKTAQAPSKTSR